MIILIYFILAFSLVFSACQNYDITEADLPEEVLRTDGSLEDVNRAIENAVAGDIIYIPAGEYTWGEDRSYININKPVTLLGSGQGETIINISPEAGKYTAGTIRLQAAATVKNMTIQTSKSGNSGTAFSTSVDGFRINGIKYINRTQNVTGYFVYAGSYGLIDNCDITGSTGNNELIFARGPSEKYMVL